MTTTYKTLGQSIPAANTATDIYTVPAATQTVVSTITICNQGVSTSFNIANRKANTALTNSQYILYNSPINQYDTVFLTIGMTLGNTDVITVQSGTANVSFNIFGSEIS